MVDMEFRMDPSCVYSTSDLGEKDEKCHGCIHKASAGSGTDTPAEPVQVGDGLANIRQGESGQPGIAGQGDVGKPADAAEHGSSDQQARAAEKLEAIYPNSAIYRRSE